ncbi:MAG TPA: Tm-1-like ATP-binding domain-containing protein [Chloroflexota bacterium]|nr:Tm-1-like ATP-binding domain-containing protein [Chloroflexota bacterium]
MLRFVVLATLDTKAPEAAFAAELIRGRGHRASIMDVGVMGDSSVTPDLPKEQVMEAAGTDPSRILGLRRDQIMDAMGRGAGILLRRMRDEGRLDGVLCLGGNQGTAIAGIALSRLPIGLPKVVVSTVASGNIRPYIGHRDVAMIFSVADLLGGPNTITRTIISNATGAMVGMAEMGIPMRRDPDRKVVAITALGNTNGVVTRAAELLEGLGYEVVAFHASGACGSAMEELIGDGLIDGVLDLTTHELVGEVLGDDIYTPTVPGRLESAGRMGILQVVAPGGIEYFCFGPLESVPAKYLGRPIHHHNPYNMNIRTTPEEMKRLGGAVAGKLNRSNGPVMFLLPLRGWSVVGGPGGPLHDPAANQVFVDALKAELLPKVQLVEMDAAINDPEVAERAVEILHRQLSAGGEKAR